MKAKSEVCTLLFEYYGDYRSLSENGITIRCMLGNGCYSAIVPTRNLEYLTNKITPLRVISAIQ
ncbi:MAG: hypothetical protein DHS20C17_11530 [Cyclobacteriaceae bacterium]|nr:MAG: hypothetical protein DHS20C17_11530 [Cyclobacteriaceae bacterium]